MALSVNTIGGYAFRTMVGQINTPQNDIQIIERPGVIDYDLRKLGAHKKPFTMVTSRDVLNLTVGRNLMASYSDLVGDDPVSMIWASHPLASEGHNVAVIGVEQLDLRAAYPIVNPFDPLSVAVLRAQWTLMLVG